MKKIKLLSGKRILPFFALTVLVVLACSSNSQSKIKYVMKKAPESGLVANIFGEKVSADDLEKGSVKIFQKRLEVYQEKKRTVDEIVRRKVFEKLAKKEGMDLEKYMEKQTKVAKKKVKDKEVVTFLTGRIKDPKAAPDHVKDQVRNILHLQKLVGSYTNRNPVEMYLQRPRAPKINFNFTNAATWGSDDAPVTIVEFSDFQCPFCARANENVVEKLKKKYGKKKIRVVFKHFPLRIHPEAKPASVASLCVNEIDKKKFWPYHDLLFANPRAMSKDDLFAYAKKLKVDEKKFKECMDSNKYEAQVNADFNEGVKIGVNSTPSFFINSQPILGARDLDEFVEIIDAEIQSAKM